MKDYQGNRGLSLAGLLASFWLCGLCVPADAQITTIFTNVDEKCNGTIIGFLGPQPLACSFSIDPAPGGLSSVMTYNLMNPPSLVGGDVVLRETGSVNSDVIRFNADAGGGSLFFYSDLDGGVDAPADIGLPTTLSTNVIFFNEVSLGALGSGLIYTPTAGQPGFVAGAPVPVQYTFISDAPVPAAVPEPSSFSLLFTGVAVAALICSRRRRRMSGMTQG